MTGIFALVVNYYGTIINQYKCFYLHQTAIAICLASTHFTIVGIVK